MKTVYQKISLIAILFLVFSVTKSVAQEFNIKDYRMMFKFATYKQADNSRMLEANFIARNKKDRKDRIPFFETEIQFYNVGADDDVLLGTALTDKEGNARLTLDASQTYETDEEGYINFRAVFPGTKDVKRARKSLAVKDVFIDLELEEVDSIKTAMINMYTLDSLAAKIPVEEVDVVIAVGGMLSKMPIEEATVEEGYYEFEFPTDIPGNAEGDIDVYVILEDHDDFANVIQQKTVNWGVSHIASEDDSNTLWSDAAPIWMYVVLTIMLVGVWANFAYSAVNLFKIKKEGKEYELGLSEKKEDQK